MKNKLNTRYWLVFLSILAGSLLMMFLTSFVMAQNSKDYIKPTLNEVQKISEVVSTTKNTSQIYYVSKVGDNSDGLSWETAFTNLQGALAVGKNGDEVWVASGIYTPSTNATEAFNLVAGLAIYGGFSGNESTRNQRDWTTNLTILSGDVGGDDITDNNGVVTTTTHIVSVNTKQIIRLRNPDNILIDETTVLDGFIITAGNSIGFAPYSSGGAWNCNCPRNNPCTPTLNNLVFSGNTASWGGAMLNESCNLNINNTTFSGNVATASGGAIYNSNSSPIFYNVVFSDNSAKWGGAIINEGYRGDNSEPSFNNVTFIKNHSERYGGAMLNEGREGNSSPSLSNVVFIGNSANNGGAIFNDAKDNGNSNPNINNVTFFDNTVNNNGGAIFNDARNNGTSHSNLTNVIFWGNSANGFGNAIHNLTSTMSITTSLIQGGITSTEIYNTGLIIDGGGNISEDPLFTDSSNNDLTLQPNSPAIDTGSNAVANLPTDISGNPRISNGIIDIGAFETPFFTVTVSLSGDGLGTVIANGIDCGTDCTENYANGTAITLTAITNANTTFIGWSGGGCSGNGTCELRITEPTNVTASFNFEEYVIYLPTVMKP